MSDLFEAICNALPLISRFTCGFTTALDIKNSCRKTVDENGNEAAGHVLENYQGFDEAMKTHKPLLVQSSASSAVYNLFIPIGDCLLIMNNAGHVDIADKLKIIFEEAAPLMSRVAGGEAVLFDKLGIRFCSVGPDGGDSDRGLGQFTYLGKRAMELGRPVIGPSLLEEGALAVRIPITEQFGLGLNNVLSIRQKKLLAASNRQNKRHYTFEDIVGKSKSLLRCLHEAKRVAKTDSTVMVFGETGTGKELLVQSIHSASPRAGGPFVALNCGAIPASLVESYLFGHVAGAFTGARREGQQGVFEQAEGGTLFLDEISEMNLEHQSRLLRVLQERELVRIGGKKVIPINVRVIASTNKDLWEMATSGKFRQDLYYRLNVVELRIPALRDRIEDLPQLIRHFIKEFKDNFGGFAQDISMTALQCLTSYPWPGNIRELRNCIERVINLSTSEVIEIENIPAHIRERGAYVSSDSGPVQPWATPNRSETASFPERDNSRFETGRPAEQGNVSREMPQSDSLQGSARALEHRVILGALEQSAYNRQKAARMLGVSTTTLWRKMKKLKIHIG